MSHNVSNFGYRLTLIASNTFPTGFSVTQFADDSDMFDVPEIAIAKVTKGPNGDMIFWTVAVPILVNFTSIPGSSDDQNLSILFQANYPSVGRAGARDEITLTGVYPNGTYKTYTGGALVSGMPSLSATSEGKLKTKIYKFAFENLSGTA